MTAPHRVAGPLGILTVVAVAALGQGVPPATRGHETIEQFTARITAELAARNPAAADLFRQANAAMDSAAWGVAEGRLREVIALAPDFDHAKRRLCSTLLRERRRADAVVQCREAWAAAKSRENRSALAYALAVPIEGDAPPAGALSEAASLAVDIVVDTASDQYALGSACMVAIAGQNVSLLRQSVARLDQVAPSDVATNYFGYILALAEKDWDGAEARIRKAESEGLAADAVADARRTLRHERPWWPALLRTAGVVAGLWVAGVLLLLGAGALLSHAALRAAQRVAAVRAGERVGLEAGLRRAYRAVLLVSCIYYYVSVPLVLLAVVGVAAGLLYGLFAAGWVPIKLAAIIVIVAAVTVWAVVKSILVRPTKADPGTRLDTAGEPRLAAVLEEVAGEIGTRPVDGVFLTPGTDFAVMERGGMLAQMRGATERCLILGVGVLDGMRLGPFKAILAHEYGHFSNRDTAGGGFALAVRLSMLQMARGLAEGGAAAWYNPAWLFLNAFYRVFLRISHGASRLQEVLADRWAVLAYGAEAFERGLRHVIARAVEFEAHANATLREVIDAQAPLPNLSAYRPAQAPAGAELEDKVAKAIAAPPSAYDSHPAPAQRIAWAHRIATRPTGRGADAGDEAWSLFADRAAIEALMTEQVRRNVNAAHGVAIAGAPAAG